jgi:PAS domain S-box-containing protein
VQHQATHARRDDGESNRVSLPLKRFTRAWRSLPGLRGGIGLRLLLRVLLFSLVIALLLTLVQLYLDYRRDVGAIDQRLSEIDSGYRRSLGEGLWRLDARQLQLQAEGILHLPDIRYVELREATNRAAPLVVTAGSRQANPSMRREFKIYYTNHGAEQLVGILLVEATFDRIYRQLFDTAAVILVGQAIMTFIVSFFILLIVHRLITRHLTGIETSLRGYDLHGSPAPLRLDRRRPGDELDRLVEAFNDMYARLQAAYGDLAEREAKIRRLVDSNIIGIFVWDFEGRILGANDEFLRMVNYDRQDLVAGRIRWADLTPPDWRDRNNARIEQQKGSGRFEPFEKEYARKDGSRVPVLIGGATFEEGGNEGVAFVLDLTERKRAEQALRESEAKIRRLVDSNVIGIFVWNFEGRFLEANDEFLRMVGYDREHLLAGGIRWTDLTPPDWRDRSNTRIEQGKSSGRFEPFEKEYTRKDGSRVPVLIGGAMFEDGGNEGVAFVVDLTERKRAEYLTEQMFERSSDRISIVGRDYRYQRANPAFERRWGMPAETIVGMQVADLLGMESFEQMAKPYLDRCFAGEEVTYVDWLTTPLGRRYSAVTYSPLQPESERVEAALVTIRDLTEHMLASEALREAQMELAHVNRVTTMGQLTASITHEVNQPITAAVTYALAARRWLSAEPPNFREVDEALSLIVKEGNRAGEVIGRIRALIKKAPARKDAVEINDAILEVIALTRTEAANNSVSVRTQLAEGLPRVEGDRVQLQQVLLNFIINAIEAMRDIGGEERELLISSRNEPDGVSVEVRDSGPGFAPATLGRVFEAFYTTKPGGLGLGLSICRSIIEAHNGRLWASPNVPRGAIFGFSVPAHPAAAS